MLPEFGKSTQLLEHLIEKLGRLAACNSQYTIVRVMCLNLNFDRAGVTEQALPFVANIVNKLKELRESQDFKRFSTSCNAESIPQNSIALVNQDYFYFKQILKILRNKPDIRPANSSLLPFNTGTTDRTYLFDNITRTVLANYFVSEETQAIIEKLIKDKNLDRNVMMHFTRNHKSAAPRDAAQFIIAEAMFSLEILLSEDLILPARMPESWEWPEIIETYYKLNGKFALTTENDLVDVELNNLNPRSLRQ